MSRKMKRIAVIGYGSTIRSDDSAGIVALKQLKQRFQSSKDIEFFEICNTVDLFGLFERFDRIIMIDAGDIKKNAGEFERFRFSELNLKEHTSISHSLQFNLITEMAEKMGYELPEIVIYIIQPKTMEIGEELSPDVKSGVEKMKSRIEKEILSVLEEKEKTGDGKNA